MLVSASPTLADAGRSSQYIYNLRSRPSRAAEAFSAGSGGVTVRCEILERPLDEGLYDQFAGSYDVGRRVLRAHLVSA